MTRRAPFEHGAYVMKIVDYARGGIVCPFKGQYLAAFEPYAGIKGTFVNDPAKAMHFASIEDGWQTWMTSIGIRPDGKADRPLTAFSVEILPLEEAE